MEETLKNIDSFCELFSYPKILQTDNWGEFKNSLIKIHNNKKHSTTKRIPKEIRDITDE